MTDFAHSWRCSATSQSDDQFTLCIVKVLFLLQCFFFLARSKYLQRRHLAIFLDQSRRAWNSDSGSSGSTDSGTGSICGSAVECAAAGFYFCCISWLALASSRFCWGSVQFSSAQFRFSLLWFGLGFFCLCSGLQHNLSLAQACPNLGKRFIMFVCSFVHSFVRCFVCLFVRSLWFDSIWLPLN